MTNKQEIIRLISVTFLIALIGIIPLKLKGEDYKIYHLNKCPQIVINGNVAGSDINGKFLIDKDLRVTGYYEYNKFRQKINLTGKIIRDTLILVELDDNLMPRAKFKGAIDFDCVSGKWTDLKTQKQHSFDFKSNLGLKESSCRSTLAIEINYQTCNVMSDLIYNPFSYGIKYSKDTLGFHYCLIEMTSYSHGGCRYRGTCGCGLESTLLYLKLDQSMNTISKQEILYLSCLNSIVLSNQSSSSIDNESDIIDFEIFDARNDIKTRIQFDKKQPELGFLKTEL